MASKSIIRMTERLDQLQAGAEQLGVKLDDATAAKLLAYLALLYKWNRAYNLTAIRDESGAIPRQLLDSLSILPFIGDGSVLDIGSGGGLPGIPIAICRPHQQITLLDSNSKKTRFLNQARMELALDNLTVAQARIESWRPDTPPDIITSRAFASLSQILDWCAHLLGQGTVIVAMKGQYPADELEAIAGRKLDVAIERVIIPGMTGERHIVSIRGFC